ncbi:MAG: hypothetical protein V3R37_00380 [Rhodospirillales bacterium]
MKTPKLPKLLNFVALFKRKGDDQFDDDDDYTEKGLLLKKLASKIGMPRSVVDINIDEVPSLLAIEAQLLHLESILKEKKFAVAVAPPYPRWPTPPQRARNDAGNHEPRNT